MKRRFWWHYNSNCAIASYSTGEKQALYRLPTRVTMLNGLYSLIIYAIKIKYYFLRLCTRNNVYPQLHDVNETANPLVFACFV